MANLYPNISTNSDVIANWYDADTGLQHNQLPTLSDNIYCNGKVITLTHNLECNNISSLAYGYSLANGGISIPNGGFSITANGNISGGSGNNSGVINISHTTGGNTDIICNGKISGRDDIGGTNGYFGVYITIGAGNSCSVTFNDVAVGNTTIGNGNNFGINVNSDGNVTLTKTSGAWKPASSYTRYAIVITAKPGGTITLNSDTGGNSLGTEKEYFANILSTGGNIILNGNYQGNNVSGGSAYICNIGAINGLLTHNGNATAGTYSHIFNMSTANSKYKNTNGTLTGSNNTNYVVYNTQSTSIIDVYNVTSDVVGAIFSSVANDIIVRGSYITKNGIQPVYAPKWRVDPSNAQTFIFQDSNGNDRATGTGGIDVNPAPENDVRYGVIYGSTNQFTGKCRVADKAYTAAGVLVDVSDVGTFTGGATPKEIWDYLIATDPIVAGSVKERFLAQATVDSTGAQLASLGG